MSGDQDAFVVRHALGDRLAKTALCAYVKPVGRFVEYEKARVACHGEADKRFFLLPHRQASEVQIGSQLEYFEIFLYLGFVEIRIERSID